MKKKLIKLALIFLSSCTLIACSEESVDDVTVPNLVEQNVVLSSGINFDNSENVVLNPLTGGIVKPCKENATNSSKEYDKQGQKDCKINESDIVAPAPVLDAIKSSRENFKGFIKKDGKDIPARFSISVSVLYEGSMCLTHWAGGSEYDNCTSVKQVCNYYVPSYRHRRITGNIRNTCKQFQGWPNKKIPLP